MNRSVFRNSKKSKIFLTILFAVISIIYILPIVTVLINSFKANAYINTETFALPTEESYVGLDNYIKGMNYGNYPFFKAVGYSLVITIFSTALILICTSMAAWYITRVNSRFCKLVYLMCVFSMVVPFQMVMFTLAKTADSVHIPYYSFLSRSLESVGLNTPWTIPIIYLGFGAGLAVFMFCGFVKSIPLEVEEASMIDGCTPIQTFFQIVLPMLKPTCITIAILQVMWIWNDYLLPYLVLDIRKYKTIPIAVQYLRGGYGSIDMGAMMAMLVLAIIPIIVFYLLCQKHIIEGVAAGAVKG